MKRQNMNKKSVETRSLVLPVLSLVIGISCVSYVFTRPGSSAPAHVGMAPALGLITNLSVNDSANASDWSVQSLLATGDDQFGDRAYTFTSVPSSVAGSAWIRTANDSKAYTGSALVTFTVTADCDVYVASNDRIGVKPSWLSSANGWADSGSNLVNSESTPKTFSLFKKSFTANSTVSLGNNGSATASMYTVIVSGHTTASPNGNPLLPPKWAFGVLLGSYYDQELVLDAMNRLRDGYCGDLLWVDSSWLSSEYNDAPKYITFKFDPVQFPDPAGMIRTLHDNHFKFGVWEWPFIDISNSLYNFGASRGYFIKNSSGDVVDGGGWHGVTFTGQFDFTNPGAVNWWKSLNQPLVDMGVDFFKIDTYSTAPSGGALFDGSSSTDRLRRAYHKTVFEVTQAASGGRGFILAHRPGSTANDQYPGMWTGDTSASWSGWATELGRAAQMNKTTNAAYWGGDSGGYNGNPSDELYIRWLQYSTFTPLTEFFSAKGTKTRFPWVFGAQAQQMFKMYTNLRYRLLPFRYSNAQIAYHESPVKYPVRFVSGRTDEIIVGNGSSEILVAPVITQGATSRQAQLPAGATWINYWTGASAGGGSALTVSAPLDRVPIFVKAGSIIPMGPSMEYVDQEPADPLTLDIYPSGATSYTLYEDDGVSNAYISGAFSKTRFTCDTAGGQVTVSIGASTGTYTGKLPARAYVLKINGRSSTPGSVTRDGDSLTKFLTRSDFDAALEGWFYDANADIAWVKFRISTSDSTTVLVD